MEAVVQEYIDTPLALPWPLICRLACMARCLGCSLDELVEQALVEHMERPR